MLHKEQRYYCVSILRKITTNQYANLVKKGVFDNKAFWKVTRLLHSDKTYAKKQINLGEKVEILKTDSETSEVSNFIFRNIVQNLEINQY